MWIILALNLEQYKKTKNFIRVNIARSPSLITTFFLITLIS